MNNQVQKEHDVPDYCHGRPRGQQCLMDICPCYSLRRQLINNQHRRSIPTMRDPKEILGMQSNPYFNMQRQA
ncbi:hypothetical protein C5167_024960 [Papaver somniferum]|uniref:Uncharacterized protein n=1 Tax=Papaver somniferum TaxID=3469 RepID=A0A4Y7JTD3_PAPSO|nr:hypothetical protein C5167_024960 [Papaver somniferum]